MKSAAERFWKLRSGVEVYRSINVIRELDRARADAKELEAKKKTVKKLSVEEEGRLKELKAIIKNCKASAIACLRSEAPDCAIDWFDACQRIGVDNSPMPLLGSGGNDGSRDFGMNFGDALDELFDFATGKPRADVSSFVRSSLYNQPVAGLRAGNVGQYEPGAVGENTSSGFTGEHPFNPFDLVLLLEGAMLFSGATTRRLGSEAAAGISVPFGAKALTAGSGAASSSDDQSFWEFWAPIWTRAASLEEMKALLTEGRVAIDGRTARDGLEFAVAVRRLGTERGISEFQRYALLQREPRNPRKATPLGRVRALENPRASLVSELEVNAWLSRARRTVRDKSVPASLSALGRGVEEALFRLAGDDSAHAVQEALITLGAFMLEVTRRTKLRENLRPPPRLSHRWARSADDNSHEFALAAALASLGSPSYRGSAEPAQAEPETADMTLSEATDRSQLPFRCHLGPIETHGRYDDWVDAMEAHSLVVWTGRDLYRDMTAVLERRLIESERGKFVDEHGQRELPLGGARAAPLSAICAFLARRTDDGRIAALAAGLAWARPHARDASSGHTQLPFAYAAMKPLFAPDGLGPKLDRKRNVDPLPLVRLIRAGRSDDAVELAQQLARGAGLSASFAALKATPSVNAGRLAAALLFPITDYDALIKRAYPDLTKEREENSDAA